MSKSFLGGEGFGFLHTECSFECFPWAQAEISGPGSYWTRIMHLVNRGKCEAFRRYFLYFVYFMFMFLLPGLSPLKTIHVKNNPRVNQLLRNAEPGRHFLGGHLLTVQPAKGDDRVLRGIIWVCYCSCGGVLFWSWYLCGLQRNHKENPSFRGRTLKQRQPYPFFWFEREMNRRIHRLVGKTSDKKRHTHVLQFEVQHDGVQQVQGALVALSPSAEGINVLVRESDLFRFLFNEPRRDPLTLLPFGVSGPFFVQLRKLDAPWPLVDQTLVHLIHWRFAPPSNG